jgi:hypothetical protein
VRPCKEAKKKVYLESAGYSMWPTAATLLPGHPHGILIIDRDGASKALQVVVEHLHDEKEVS